MWRPAGDAACGGTSQPVTQMPRWEEDSAKWLRQREKKIEVKTGGGQDRDEVGIM